MVVYILVSRIDLILLRFTFIGILILSFMSNTLTALYPLQSQGLIVLLLERRINNRLSPGHIHGFFVDQLEHAGIYPAFRIDNAVSDWLKR